MPIDAAGEVVIAALEVVAEAALDIPEPSKRSRLRRFIYWSVLTLVVGFLLAAIYLALS